MRNLFLMFALICCNVSIGQVVTFMYVEVSNENQQRFERLEKDYWSQVAKKAIDDGKMMSWIMLKEISIPGTHKYLFVNYFENLEQLSQASSIWNIPEELGMNIEDINTNGIKRIVNVEYWKAEASAGESAKYLIMNYFTPANLEGFVTENLELWKPWFEKNMKNNRLKQKNWAIGTKIYPSNQSGSSAITRDGFDSLSDAMEALSYQPMINNMYASIVEKSKMNEYVPNGFDKRVLYELIKRVD